MNGGFDPWPYMPMPRAVTSYAEFSGDTTVVPFMTNFCGYLAGQPTSQISNVAGGFREPAVYAQLGGSSYAQGTYDSYAQFMET